MSILESKRNLINSLIMNESVLTHSAIKIPTLGPIITVKRIS